MIYKLEQIFESIYKVYSDNLFYQKVSLSNLAISFNLFCLIISGNTIFIEINEVLSQNYLDFILLFLLSYLIITMLLANQQNIIYNPKLKKIFNFFSCLPDFLLSVASRFFTITIISSIPISLILRDNQTMPLCCLLNASLIIWLILIRNYFREIYFRIRYASNSL